MDDAERSAAGPVEESLRAKLERWRSWEAEARAARAEGLGYPPLPERLTSEELRALHRRQRSRATELDGSPRLGGGSERISSATRRQLVGQAAGLLRPERLLLVVLVVLLAMLAVSVVLASGAQVRPPP